MNTAIMAGLAVGAIVLSVGAWINWGSCKKYKKKEKCVPITYCRVCELAYMPSHEGDVYCSICGPKEREAKRKKEVVGKWLQNDGNEGTIYAALIAICTKDRSPYHQYVSIYDVAKNILSTKAE